MTAVHYTVRGSWPFPLDMLRRDMSAAATPADQDLIDKLSGEFAPDRDSIRNPVEIKLVIHDIPRARPNTARWESFGWTVPTDTAYAAEKDARSREKRMQKLRKEALSKLSPDEVEALRYFGLDQRH